jgi:hypothetical protein
MTQRRLPREDSGLCKLPIENENGISTVFSGKARKHSKCATLFFAARERKERKEGRYGLIWTFAISAFSCGSFLQQRPPGQKFP